ncbi:MAG: FAS1-like dehydratase domain-containing protein [Acidimicrobiia bacterium]
MSEETLARRIERERAPWVSTATRDAIRHFAWGVGDDNPLWLDLDHAESSIWGSLVAPPCFAYAVDETTVAPDHDDHRRVYRSVDWRWYDIVRAGSELKAAALLTTEDDEDTVDDGFHQSGRLEFTIGGSVVATADSRCYRTTSPAQAIEDRPEVRYTPGELDEIEQTILAEERRGPSPRRWEDVQVGDELDPLLKGPLSIMDVVAWCAGTQGVPDDASGAHQFSEGGLHAQTATGPQQVAWLAQLLTDWMGDDAFLHRLQVDLVANPALGTTTALSGRVTGRSNEAGPASVAVGVVAESQDGEVTATGRGIILLPSLASGPVSLPLTAASTHA